MPRLGRAAYLLLTILTFAAPAVGSTDRLVVHGGGPRRCVAYFHRLGEALRWPLLLSLRGTGVYTTASHSRLDAAERALVEQGLVTLVTLDKPGIAPTDTPGTVTIDDEQYNAYVQDDLIRCSAEALTWAAAKSAEAADADHIVLLSGHSEGAQVSLRLLEHLTAKHDALATRIRGLFLSGLPMSHWRHLLKAQLSEAEQRTFFTAFQRRDNTVLRSFGNLSFTYLESVFAQKPLATTLESLKAAGTRAQFFIYQGLYDHHTPPGPVMDFLASNRRAQAMQLPALTVRSRFYPAGHCLNGEALRDIRSDMEALIAAPGTP